VNFLRKEEKIVTQTHSKTQKILLLKASCQETLIEQERIAHHQS
jgi:hypothetical protein